MNITIISQKANRIFQFPNVNYSIYAVSVANQKYKYINIIYSFLFIREFENTLPL